MNRVQKMSELLMEIADPLLDGLTLPEHEDEYRTALMIAASIWNAATFETEQERKEALAEVKRITTTPFPEDLSDICDQIYVRARERYPNESRSIADVELVEGDDGRYHLNVLSAGI